MRTVPVIGCGATIVKMPPEGGLGGGRFYKLQRYFVAIGLHIRNNQWGFFRLNGRHARSKPRKGNLAFRLGDGMFFGVLRGCARRDWRFARRSQLLGGVESHDIESHVICSLSKSDRGTRWGVWGFEG